MPEKTVWFITGASTGFGKVFAQYALSQGYCVVATARTPSKCALKDSDACLVTELDVTKSETIDKALKETMDKFGRIDVLVNNAGYGIVGAVEETPEEELRKQMETNFFGAMLVTQKVLPIMRAQRSGAIAQISSMLGSVGLTGLGAYCASKFALEGASEALASEVKPLGIKVLIVEPGAFRTEFAGVVKHMPKIDAYDDTVGGIRDFVIAVNQNQEGDPEKAAKAIDDALKSDKTPLRLVLGPDAVDGVRAKATALLQDIADWEDVARAAVFPPAAKKDT
mmetsp:Transcript_14635/g.47656  ORF Transcript_14635/g.47656 Transcript_14635/m.47656 type:complete len:281 (-) Transcript_14635:1410-2252(-)